MIATSKYIKVFNCYQLTTKQIENVVKVALEEDGFKTNRSIKSMVAEIKAHKRLYKMGLWIKHTKDADVEAKINPILDLIYRIVGI